MSSATLVLGMHKSGTTLVSDILHQSGIKMVEHEFEENYDDGNKMEREETKLLNIDLLSAIGALSYKTTKTLDVANVTPSQWARGARIINELQGEQWGFKDPRTLLTLDFWLQLIDEPKMIGVFRHPGEVYRHYKRRSFKWKIVDPLYPVLVLRAWCLYNLRLLDVVASDRDCIVLDYNKLMDNNDGVRLMESYFGMELRDTRRMELRRSVGVVTTDYKFNKRLVKKMFGLDVDGIYSRLKDSASVSLGDSLETTVSVEVRPDVR